MTTATWIILGVSLVAVVLLVSLLKWIFSLRKVVAPNEVHIVRQGSNTLVYGNASTEEQASSGNSYYRWPQWVPAIGVDVSILPLSVFDIDIAGYDAYDKDRLPFVVDIKAFFRISNYKIAAERVSTVGELKQQLLDICRGAARTILAQEDLEAIMGERSKYGASFTSEVAEQLTSWGVEPVKNIELMDIRDAKGEEVIANIMKKKKSAIEKESRVTVAQNEQEAKEAEIAAQQEVDLKQKAADETVGLRDAEVQKKVGIAKQQSDQAVKEEAKVTMEKDMEVRQVETVRAAEIARDAKVVEAEADRRKTEIDAEAARRKAELEAEASLVRATKNAEGIEAEGRAKADAEEKMQLASVSAQTSLAKEIGENEGYQKYLIEIRKVEATEKVGLEQAKNINGSNIKIIANAGNVAEGLNSALDVLTPKGGSSIAGALEAFVATDAGKALLEKLGINIG